MDVISQWWPHLLAAAVLGTALGYWLRRAGAAAAAGPADTGTAAQEAPIADTPRPPTADVETGHEPEAQRAERAQAEPSELRHGQDRLQADLGHRIEELEAQLRERDDCIARLTDAARADQPARMAFGSEPPISREEVDTLFAEIIEARKAMKAAEQEARRREEEVAGELAEAYAELQAASAAIRGREQRLSGELEEARRELEEAADRLAATRAVEQALRGELEQSLAAESVARRQAQELLEENARLSVAYRELEARLSSAMEREQAVNAELRAQLTEARGRVATMDEEEQGLREELMASQRLAEVAAERETSLRLQLDRAGQRIAALEAREAARSGAERPAPPAASIHRLEVPVPDGRESRDSRSEEGGGVPSRAAGLAVEELERLVLAAGEGCKPAGGELADGQRPDDLKAIGGIGPVNERWLHGNGIYFYAQIAGWSPEEMAWVARHLPNFGKRVYRENWVRQAAELARPGASIGTDQRRRADRH
ncbi:MAG: hypothetical protein R3F45_08360 [Gammaproteobacteria bacterium]